MVKNELYAICTQMRVTRDVISGLNVKTIESHMLVNLKIARSSSFRKKTFGDGDVTSGGVNRFAADWE